MRTKSVNLYQAKTHLSALVEEAAEGTTVVIAKNGEPRAMLVPIPSRNRRARKPANALRVTYIAEGFDDVDDDIIAAFEGGR